MLCSRYRILILPALPRRITKRLRHPVRRAHERRLGVNVRRALLLARGDDGDVVGVGAGEAVGVELRGGVVGGGVGGGVVEEEFGEVAGFEEGEGELEPGDEVGFGGDVLGDEGGAFVCVVLDEIGVSVEDRGFCVVVVGTYADQCPLAVDSPLAQLHGRSILDEDSIGDGQERPDTLVRDIRDVEACILQKLGGLVD